MELPVQLSLPLTLLSILLAAGIVGFAFRKSISAAIDDWKARRAFDKVLDTIERRATATTPEGYRVTYEPYGKPSTLESAHARLTAIRAEKAQTPAAQALTNTLLEIRAQRLASAAKASGNEGSQP